MTDMDLIQSAAIIVLALALIIHMRRPHDG
jgi:hypothetical protein